MSTDLERWQEFVARLDELGRTITAPPFPATPADDLEGLRHLALQAVCWMEWSLAHQDPRAPMFQRQNDLVAAVGRTERRQHLPPCAGAPLAHVPHRRADALVRELHPRHPSQLHAHGDQRRRSRS